jgi:hypothetical protein
VYQIDTFLSRGEVGEDICVSAEGVGEEWMRWEKYIFFFELVRNSRLVLCSVMMVMMTMSCNYPFCGH